MQIGPYELKSPFLLAPMVGITDAPFRRLCRQFGAGMTTSEMTTADISLWNTNKSRHRLDLDMDAEPRVVQIVGADPLELATAASVCVARGAQIIDINMGCPARKVCNKLAGSALLQDTRLVSRILESVVRNLGAAEAVRCRVDAVLGERSRGRGSALVGKPKEPQRVRQTEVAVVVDVLGVRAANAVGFALE